MKKVIVAVSLFIVSVALAVVTAILANRGYDAFFFELLGHMEKAVYGLWVLLAAVILSICKDSYKTVRVKVVVSFLFSVLVTACVFFYNNLLHFFVTNGVLKTSMQKIPYNLFLREDITYHFGLGIFRYILIFVISLLFCGLAVFEEEHQ